jgi:hypothetical protein
MDIIEICTLIDITQTKVNRISQGTELELNQQRNFVTLLQCVEIRSIIEFDRPPSLELKDLKTLGFGSQYKGKNRVWTFRFNTDRTNVYLDNNDNPVGSLIEDLHEVPIIKNLTETVNILKSIFDCKDDRYKNTLARLVS